MRISGLIIAHAFDSKSANEFHQQHEFFFTSKYKKKKSSEQKTNWRNQIDVKRTQKKKPRKWEDRRDKQFEWMNEWKIEK